MLRRLPLLCATVALVCVWLSAEAAEAPTSFEGQTVRDIQLRGLQRTREQIVLYKIKTKVGKPYAADTVSADERRLVESGYFNTVTVLTQPLEDGVRVIFSFQEKPTIKAILFEGNQRIKTARLQKKIAVKPGEIYDQVQLYKGIADIYELYQKKGFYDVAVVDALDFDAKANEVVVRLTVQEGRRGIVHAIEFRGIEHARPRKLRGLMKTKRHNALSWLTGRGKLKRDQLEEDVLRLHAYFGSLGYLDAAVQEPVIESIEGKKDAVRLIITVVEGPCYTMGRTTFSGNTAFPEAALREQLVLKEGDVLASDKADAQEGAIADLYSERGYVDVRVTGRFAPGEGERVLDIHYEIEEGKRVRLGKVEITGNLITKDKVIRREISLVPGDYFDGVKLRRSRSRLQNLGYFQRVDMLLEPTEREDVRDLVVVIEEANTGRFLGGVGFSSIDKLIGTVEISQSNFDLKDWPSFRGGGQKARLRFQFGTKRRDAELSFVEPWFFDRQLLFGVDVFARDNLTPKDYDESEVGFDVRLSKRLWDRVRGTLTYTLENVDINAEPDASELILREEGKKTVGSLAGQLQRDSRDSYFMPTRGSLIVLAEEVGASWLASDEEFHKETLRTAFYVSPFEGHIVRFRGEIGSVEEFGGSEDVSIFERFFMGGPRTVRGFNYRDVGPKDENGEPIGGKSSLLLSVEYTFPLVDPIRGAVFYDTGNVWSEAYDYSFSDLRAGTGIGLRILIPVFGGQFPFNIDYAWPIDRDQFVDSKPRFDFSFGFQF
jgi:outer membrane protein insertion porin family